MVSAFKITTQTIKGKPLPAVNLTEAEFDFDCEDIEVDLSGNIIAGFANIFAATFSKQFCKPIKDEVLLKMNKELPLMINKQLGALNYQE